MVAGLSFPDVYDLTWGEIVEYLRCKNEARRIELREQANMDFTASALIAKMIGGQSGTKYTVMDEYDFLWSDAERAEARRREIERRFRVKGGGEDGR